MDCRIIVAMDSSAPARRAFRYSLELAEQTGAKLTVLYIDPIIPAYYGGFSPERRYTLLAGITADDPWDSLLSEIDRGTVSIRKKRAAGNPVSLIVRMAKEEKANLIVMGSGGDSGLKGWLLGSVSQWVIRYAPCPVLIVK